MIYHLSSFVQIYMCVCIYVYIMWGYAPTTKAIMKVFINCGVVRLVLVFLFLSKVCSQSFLHN